MPKMEPTDNLYTCSILENIAKSEGFVDPEINAHGQVGKGEGFTGDVFFVSINDNSNDKKLQLVVKQSCLNENLRNILPIHRLFQNECIFYTRVWPEFTKMQTEHLKSQLFDNVPKCYATDVQEDTESLILENLVSRNFMTIDKKQFFDAEHVEFIFGKYGQFHGLSFAYKTQHPEEYAGLSELLANIWDKAVNSELFSKTLGTAIEKCLTFFDPSNDLQIIENIKEYLKDDFKLFQNIIKYTGNHGAIVHGDCWSNNMMFKYDETGKLQDMKLIDFQASSLGSVVYDLSYFFYSGGTRDIWDKLDDYLKIYHRNLSETCRKLGCKDFISFQELKEEWKEYSKFGFLMALILFKAKLSKDMDKADISDFLKTFNERKEIIDEQVDEADEADEANVKKQTKSLVYYMLENGFL